MTTTFKLGKVPAAECEVRAGDMEAGLYTRDEPYNQSSLWVIGDCESAIVISAGHGNCTPGTEFDHNITGNWTRVAGSVTITQEDDK